MSRQPLENVHMSGDTTKEMERRRAEFASARSEIAKVVVGLENLVERLVVGMLCDGHVLIEGVPGLAKTLTVSVLAQTIGVKFNRIQFTPDLLPGDLIGTMVYNQKTGEFTPHQGPIFTNIILADEINRSPAKVQSALLEAMQEHQVTIGDESYKLDEPFLVLATQNPIEQEGTYPLPEAQLDRFMLKVTISYPSLEEEREIMTRMAASSPKLDVDKVLSGEDVLETRKLLDAVRADGKIEEYILRIVDATRNPGKYGLEKLEKLIRHGASPRAAIYLLKTARAKAFLAGRDYVLPEDVKDIGMDVLRHRVATTYKAEADDICSEDIVRAIFDHVEVGTG